MLGDSSMEFKKTDSNIVHPEGANHAVRVDSIVAIELGESDTGIPNSSYVNEIQELEVLSPEKKENKKNEEKKKTPNELSIIEN
jgi:hypothetical protein